jgi:hypothetical protein
LADQGDSGHVRRGATGGAQGAGVTRLAKGSHVSSEIYFSPAYHPVASSHVHFSRLIEKVSDYWDTAEYPKTTTSCSKTSTPSTQMTPLLPLRTLCPQLHPLSTPPASTGPSQILSPATEHLRIRPRQSVNRDPNCRLCPMFLQDYLSATQFRPPLCRTGAGGSGR